MGFSDSAKPSDFTVGDRVQLHPATDTWMSGDAFGDVVRVGRIWVHVKLDKSGRVRRTLPKNLALVEGTP